MGRVLCRWLTKRSPAPLGIRLATPARTCQLRSRRQDASGFVPEASAVVRAIIYLIATLLVLFSLPSRRCCHPETVESVARDRLPTKDLCIYLRVPLCPLWFGIFFATFAYFAFTLLVLVNRSRGDSHVFFPQANEPSQRGI